MKAILIGATGLVGSEILKLLLADPAFTSVTVLTRRRTGAHASKLAEHLVDFERLADWKSLIRGDCAFSALGSTRSQAGGIANQRRVDYDYQAEFARLCSENGVGKLVLVSSVNASSRSRIPYLKMKGELEDQVRALPFRDIRILQPGPLVGVREKRRRSEELSSPFLRILSALPGLAHLRPIQAEEVARQAVAAALGRDRSRNEPSNRA